MAIFIFVVVLVVLILVHEMGHFLAAKYFGIRVDEFGIGFPPRLKTLFWWGETRFSLNAIPFGGFVKIFGEDPDEKIHQDPERERSFAYRSKPVQAVVLFSGVFFNALLAVFLIFISFIIGVPSTDEAYDGKYLHEVKVTVMGVLENSPAENVGLKAGDTLFSVRDTSGEEVLIQKSDDLSSFVSNRVGEEVFIVYERGDDQYEVAVTPREEIIDEEERGVIGVSLTSVGMLSLPPHIALVESFKYSIELTGRIAVELGRFFGNVITGKADFSEVAGPVGIVGLVGDAWTVGFSFLLFFTAVISLHLTIINLLPFPALDGGRLLFVVIESLVGKPIDPKFANALNGLGFIFLIILMIVITISDVSRLFG